MRRRIPIVLMAVAFVMLLAPMQQAMAVESCSYCQSNCEYYCAINGLACFQSVADCGTGTCNFQCSVGGWHWGNCGCPTGSPIFRKKPIQPAPTSMSSMSITQDAATQVCAPQVSETPAKPESKPAAKVEPKPAPRP